MRAAEALFRSEIDFRLSQLRMLFIRRFLFVEYLGLASHVHDRCKHQRCHRGAADAQCRAG